MSDAVVVGSGPNGLSAAVAIAQGGFSVTVVEAADDIGGGTRSRELTVPGVLHDVCSAVHPFAAISPFFRSLDLQDHGLEWRRPEIDLAHPLEDGEVAVMVRSIDETAGQLGRDGYAWRRLVGSTRDALDDLVEDLLRPVQHIPRHPFKLARFGPKAVQPATLLARHFKTRRARALFGGTAAHTIYPLNRPATSAVGLMLAAACHKVGWPVAAGGSQSIAKALAGLLDELGGTVETGVRIDDLGQLPRCRVALLDVAPRDLVRIAGDRLPRIVRTQLSRWRRGPAVFKVDLAVEGGVPWRAEACRRAGTVHLGGTLEQLAAAENDVNRGAMPERPFILVAQQYLADPQRSNGNIHPIWAYAHVPNGYPGDATDTIIDEIERYAPGLRDRIVGQHSWNPAQFEAYNPNYAGGDVATGANDPWQLLVRPRLAIDPYWTGIPGVFICSAATPPGIGIHGMCGANAAQSALKVLKR